MKDRFDLRLQPPRHHRLGHSVRNRWHPKVLVPPPWGLGISTAFTGGGKYDPDDIRFQILYRLFFRSLSNSSSVTPSTPGAPRLAFTCP
jgi:hypothetical protein